MKEIKFRAWDTKRNEIVYFDLNLCNDESRRWYDEQIHNNDIMQYTGLKDKNGVEIYEGDIISVTSNGYSKYISATGSNCVVKYFDKECCFIGERIEKSHIELSEYFQLGTKAEIKVIGNIYENKDLIGD